MSEWVLVPVEFDDQTYEGIWTAAYNEWAEFGSADKDAGRAAVVAMLAARPPIPHDVWDAMVERGARATWESYAPIKGEWWTVQGDLKEDILRQFASGFRAALGSPRVEGDEP